MAEIHKRLVAHSLLLRAAQPSTMTRITLSGCALSAVILLPAAVHAQRYPYPQASQYRYQPEGSVKFDVRPKDADVYVDGYYIGRVDDFDSLGQSAKIPAGEHEIAIYKEGYRLHRERLRINPRGSKKISGRLEPLVPGETQPEPPQPSPEPPAQGTGDQQRLQGAQGQQNRAGMLAIRVHPADAELIIDGEPWQASPGDSRLIVELSEGRHIIEIRKPGYRPFSTEVMIHPRQTTPLNVSLSRE